MTVRPAESAEEAAAALDLRVRVFCGEQGVDGEEELDGFDDAATQIVALVQGGVIATCRLRFLDDEASRERICKLERMAVERGLRGLGVGGKLLDEAEAAGLHQGARTMVLHAQVRARDFYARHGYVPEGETFMEAEIEHVRMTKALE